MSKKRKQTRGNPAKQAVVRYARVDPPKRRHCAYCRHKTSVQPHQESTEMARLPHHPLPKQEWVPGCAFTRKMSLSLLESMWKAEGVHADSD